MITGGSRNDHGRVAGGSRAVTGLVSADLVLVGGAGGAGRRVGPGRRRRLLQAVGGLPPAATAYAMTRMNLMTRMTRMARMAPVDNGAVDKDGQQITGPLVWKGREGSGGRRDGDKEVAGR